MSDPLRTGGLTSRPETLVDGQAARPAALPGPWGTAAHRGADQASRLMKQVFRSFDGSLALRLWNGTTLRLREADPQASDPPFTLVCHHPGFVRSMVLGRDPLRLAEANFQGDIDVEGDFFTTLSLRNHLHSSPDESLNQAQCNKLEHICRKLRLQPGERLLDIGCGWGALVCWAARHHGVRAHGITLSRQQLEYAQQRIRTEGLQGLVTAELRDYQDLEGEFNRYVFPDGELDCVSNIQLGMERAGFAIHDFEGLRPHYALTLRHWVRRLEANRDAALREVDDATNRVWRLYMAACALDFEARNHGHLSDPRIQAQLGRVAGSADARRPLCRPRWRSERVS